MYRKGPQGWRKHLDFMVLDLLCLQVSFVVSCMMRNGIYNPYMQLLYRNMAIVFTVIDAGVLVFFETMKNVLKRGYYKEFSMTLKHVLLVVLLATFYLFYTQIGQEYSRLALFYMGGCYLGITYGIRLLWKRNLKKRMKSGGRRSLLIVTKAGMRDTVVENIKNYNYEMFHIAGIAFLDCDLCGQKLCGVPVVADRETVVEYVCREWIDEVFLNLPPEESCQEELVNQFTEMGVVVHIKLMTSSGLPGEKRFVERLGIYTVLTTSISCATDRQLFMKRAMDIVGGTVGCMITAVLFVILGPLIWIQSPGPVIFSQTRVGRNGKKFRLYKFRSMYPDAEKRKQELLGENRVKDGMMFKLDWDPRIIGSKRGKDGSVRRGIGNLIRDWSLDEYPQFFNVLKGDMSLVGTRPPTVDEWEKYALHHRARLVIKPGITGMWQVSGRSNITDFEEVVELDRKYIAEWSMGLDIKILMKTLFVVFKRDGAL